MNRVKFYIKKIEKEDINHKDFLNKVSIKFSKEEMVYIFNNKEYMKIFIKKLTIKKMVGKDMWSLQTDKLTDILVDSLFDIKSIYNIEITPVLFTYFLNLDNLIKLLSFLNQKGYEKKDLKEFLNELPDFKKHYLNNKAYEKFNYLVTFFREINSIIFYYDFEEEDLDFKNLIMKEKIYNF